MRSSNKVGNWKQSFPRRPLSELTQATDPKAWSLEGRALCLDAVYKHGAVKGARQQGADDPSLPEGYFTAAHAVAERRVVLAADRLTDTLDTLLPTVAAQP